MAHLRFLNPPTLSKPPTYSHVVEIMGPGRIIYIAGQLGLGVDGRLWVAATFVRRQTNENQKAPLLRSGPLSTRWSSSTVTSPTSRILRSCVRFATVSIRKRHPAQRQISQLTQSAR